MVQDTLQFAVVGTGFWAQYQIAAWQEISQVRLVAVCDRDAGRAAAIAARFGIPAIYTDAAEMIRCERLDFVDIAAGPEAHEALVKLAAQAGIGVICQKPMALDYDACQRMVQACKSAGVAFLVHENFRWQKPMRRVRNLLASGVIGTPFRAHIQFSHGDIALFDNQPYLFEQGHFAMFDMGPHLLDLARFFFGEPERVYARERRVNKRFQGEDLFSVQLEFQNVLCHCELTWRTTDHEVFVEGLSGTITYNPSGWIRVNSAAGATEERVEPDIYEWADPRYGFAHSSIVTTNRNLLEAFAGNPDSVETTAEDNLRTMQLMFLGLESAQTGRALAVNI